jgi:hypothetical protein
MLDDRHCCYNCHFFSWYQLSIPDSPSGELAPRGREALLHTTNKQDILEQTGNESRLCCQKNIWRHKRKETFSDHKPLVHLLTQDRGDTCFFYPYKEGISFDAAAELQGRDETKREKEEDRALVRQANRYSKWALGIAIAALLATVAWNIWAHLHSATPPK